MATGDVIKIGGFYLAGTLKSRPVRPWRNDTTPPGASAAGDVSSFSAGQTIEIRDTPTSDANKLQWIEIVDRGKTYLVSDRVLLVNVSWDDLNAQGLITGKEIMIDGQKYLLRVLTGGANYRNGSDAYSGGTQPNEWDRWICNEAGLNGLPTPTSTDLDTNQNSIDLNSTHNQKWNWYYIYSWCQETYTGNSATRVIRGYLSARFWHYYTSSYRYADYGWRPVLEVLNSAPVISGTDENLGSQSKALQKTYSVRDAEADTFSIVEKIDGTTLRTINPATDGANYIYDLTSVWGSLSLGTHTATITATDKSGATSVRTWTFSKTNQSPAAPLIDFPLSGMRTGLEAYVLFRPQVDQENDTQTFKVQIADDNAFSLNLTQITTGFEINRTGAWEPLTTWKNTDLGNLCRVKIPSLTLYKKKYIRIGATDSGSQSPSYSDTQHFGVGDELDVLSKKFDLNNRPSKLNVIDSKVIDKSVAEFKVFVTNNANDMEIIWEDATQNYLAGIAHTFTNYKKTAEKWSVQVKYYVKAGLATGDIFIMSHGGGIS